MALAMISACVVSECDAGFDQAAAKLVEIQRPARKQPQPDNIDDQNLPGQR